MIGIVLLAAGEARRFGSPKQLAEIDRVPMVCLVAQAAAKLDLPMRIVTGAYRDQVEAVLSAYDCVFHADWPQGMGSSIAYGVRALHIAYPDLQGVLILLGDQPHVTTAALQRLLAAYADHPGHIIVSAYPCSLGAPCLFPATDFDALKSLHGTEGARSVWQQRPGNIVTVAMPEAAFDVDTPADLERHLP